MNESDCQDSDEFSRCDELGSKGVEGDGKTREQGCQCGVGWCDLQQSSVGDNLNEEWSSGWDQGVHSGQNGMILSAICTKWHSKLRQQRNFC
jgi:hypothetical protein